MISCRTIAIACERACGCAAKASGDSRSPAIWGRYWTNRWMSARAMMSMKLRYSDMVTPSKAKSASATLKCRIEGPQA